MKEIWKDIPEYEGYYQVSNIGRVKRLPRNGDKFNANRLSVEKILSAGKSGCGYLTVSLVLNFKRKTFKVHKLVAMAFLNHNPCGHKFVIDHIDNNRENNKVNNLEIVTPRQNAIKRNIKSTSKYVGVCWSKSHNKWRSEICINGKSNYLGLYGTELEAHQAYQNALNNIIKL
jgi:hypothetical protein